MPIERQERTMAGRRGRGCPEVQPRRASSGADVGCHSVLRAEAVRPLAPSSLCHSTSCSEGVNSWRLAFTAGAAPDSRRGSWAVSEPSPQEDRSGASLSTAVFRLTHRNPDHPRETEEEVENRRLLHQDALIHIPNPPLPG